MIRRILAVLAAALLLFAGCRQNNLPRVDGRVVDATIHSITLLTAAGDSVTLSTLGTDPMLVPGVLPGDEVHVGYEVLPDGETMRALYLRITHPSAYRLLPGIWRDCTGAEEVGLVLAEDGSAKYVGADGPELRHWSLDGDNLALTASDGRVLMYRIESLGADSLVIRPQEEGLRALSLSRSE
jgi:hypothetical protein